MVSHRSQSLSAFLKNENRIIVQILCEYSFVFVHIYDVYSPAFFPFPMTFQLVLDQYLFVSAMTMTMTHPNEVSTGVNLALRTRTQQKESVKL